MQNVGSETKAIIGNNSNTEASIERESIFPKAKKIDSKAQSEIENKLFNLLTNNQDEVEDFFDELDKKYQHTSIVKVIITPNFLKKAFIDCTNITKDISNYEKCFLFLEFIIKRYNTRIVLNNNDFIKNLTLNCTIKTFEKIITYHILGKLLFSHGISNPLIFIQSIIHGLDVSKLALLLSSIELLQPQHPNQKVKFNLITKNIAQHLINTTTTLKFSASQGIKLLENGYNALNLNLEKALLLLQLNLLLKEKFYRNNKESTQNTLSNPSLSAFEDNLKYIYDFAISSSATLKNYDFELYKKLQINFTAFFFSFGYNIQEFCPILYSSFKTEIAMATTKIQDGWNHEKASVQIVNYKQVYQNAKITLNTRIFLKPHDIKEDDINNIQTALLAFYELSTFRKLGKLGANSIPTLKNLPIAINFEIFNYISPSFSLLKPSLKHIIYQLILNNNILLDAALVQSKPQHLGQDIIITKILNSDSFKHITQAEQLSSQQKG
jgi:hypothetical protein